MTSVKNKVILHSEDKPAHATIVRKALQLKVANVQLTGLRWQGSPNRPDQIDAGVHLINTDTSLLHKSAD